MTRKPSVFSVGLSLLLMTTFCGAAIFAEGTTPVERLFMDASVQIASIIPCPGIVKPPLPEPKPSPGPSDAPNPEPLVMDVAARTASIISHPGVVDPLPPEEPKPSPEPSDAPNPEPL